MQIRNTSILRIRHAVALCTVRAPFGAVFAVIAVIALAVAAGSVALALRPLLSFSSSSWSRPMRPCPALASAPSLAANHCPGRSSAPSLSSSFFFRPLVLTQNPGCSPPTPFTWPLLLPSTPSFSSLSSSPALCFALLLPLFPLFSISTLTIVRPLPPPPVSSLLPFSPFPVPSSFAFFFRFSFLFPIFFL
jgi:hypothetical protein